MTVCECTRYDYLMLITLFNYYIIMYFFIVVLLISLFI